ncbi:MAG: hypothetical protein EPO52_16175 [Herbiconiux sp.]|nr:MAG: hypothetical protein EPO52_16175 [Herbiconiux sp.]
MCRRPELPRAPRCRPPARNRSMLPRNRRWGRHTPPRPASRCTGRWRCHSRRCERTPRSPTPCRASRS